MFKDLRYVNIVDLEATCWDKDKQPQNEQHEIIEVGIAEIDLHNLLIMKNKSFYVKPAFSKISSFCTKLTKISQDKIDKEGINFSQALDLLKKEFHIHNRTWISWGDYDRVQVEKNCQLYNIKNPFNRSHINLKNLYSLIHKLDREIGMATALNQLNMELKGQHHSGKDDAYNIARIFLNIYERMH